MAIVANIQDEGDSKSKKKNQVSESSTAIASRSLTDELVIAFCGPIGAPIEMVVESFKKEISEARGYYSEPIKISTLIKRYGKLDDFDSLDKIQKKKAYIAGGDALREKSNQPEILAALAMVEIRDIKKKVKDESQKKVNAPHRICFLIDSLKTPSEVQLLQEVYRDSFFLVGVQTPMDKRINDLTGGDPKFEAGAKKLIETDYEGDKNNPYTQKLGKIFHWSDYFINSYGNNPSATNAKVKRFADIVFGTDIVTPTVHEKSMYAAWAAAANSACMSRQVGASVVSKDGVLLSTGWNDVPKATGGVYTIENQYGEKDDTTEEKRDNRCFRYNGNHCRNSTELNRIIEDTTNEILNGIKGTSYISDEELNEILGKQKELDFAYQDNDSVKIHLKEMLVKALKEKGVIKNKLKDSRISSLTEFSRAIHAEMHALFNALKEHSSGVTGGSIYVTTFPCHNCARHIVLSGVMNIYFIEPYPKSMALNLHPDALTELPDRTGKVRLLPFEGIAPSRYLDLFSYKDEKRKSKTDNKLEINQPKLANPRKRINLESINLLEQNIIKNYAEFLKNEKED